MRERQNEKERGRESKPCGGELRIRRTTRECGSRTSTREELEQQRAELSLVPVYFDHCSHYARGWDLGRAEEAAKPRSGIQRIELSLVQVYCDVGLHYTRGWELGLVQPRSRILRFGHRPSSGILRFGLALHARVGLRPRSRILRFGLHARMGLRPRSRILWFRLKPRSRILRFGLSLHARMGLRPRSRILRFGFSLHARVGLRPRSRILRFGLKPRSRILRFGFKTRSRILRFGLKPRSRILRFGLKPSSVQSIGFSLDKNNALREIKLRLAYLQGKSTTMSVIAHQTEKESISAKTRIADKESHKHRMRAQQSNMQPDLRKHICEHIIRVLQHQKDVNQKQHICVKHDFVITMNGVDMDLFFISDKSLFHLSGYVNSQKGSSR
ncbi:hypothetical protein TNCV_4604381 [Trichonephila clavipes]|nr:hypothetical protein TNCV_4604381 [Trichonephila clavipes]